MDITNLINQILEQLGLGSLDRPENSRQAVLRILEDSGHSTRRLSSRAHRAQPETQRALTRANADARVVRPLTNARLLLGSSPLDWCWRSVASR